MSPAQAIDFFESQFRRQVREADYALNPFETLALPYLEGTVLDLGCGLGNLSLEAARRGCRVTAVDASPTAVERIRKTATEEGLAVEAMQADLGGWRIPGRYDAVVAIGLLMFFPCAPALAMLERIKAAVKPGGCAVVNVLVQGTTYMGMFDRDHFCLFAPDEMERRFRDWEMLENRAQRFPAPGDTVKVFSTVIARRPAAEPRASEPR